METASKVDGRLNSSRNSELKDFCRYVKKGLLKHVQFKQHHNAKFRSGRILDVLINGAKTHDFLESASKDLKKSRGEGNSPSADSVLRYISKFSEEEMKSMFQRTFGEIIRQAKKLGVFRRRVDVAIDCHDKNYYGKKNDFGVVEGEYDRGTCHFFRYMTITIVEKGRRFTLKSLMVTRFSNKELQVEELLRYAMKVVKIRKVYMDRGFFDSKMIRLLNHLGLSYVIRARAMPNIVKMTKRKKQLPFVVQNFKLKSVYTNLVVVQMRKPEPEKGRDGRVYYVTNIPTNDKDINSLEMFYRKRWGIETSYRLKKHKFSFKTTSKNYLVRDFLFLFSVALYNLYYLANIMVCFRCMINWIIPKITASMFISWLLITYTPPLKNSGGYG